MNFFKVFLLIISLVFLSCNTVKNLFKEELQNNEKLIMNNEQEFTIAVIPDTQEYTSFWNQKKNRLLFQMDFRDIFTHQTEFIRQNSLVNGGNIVFAVHLGDLVSNLGNKNEEWEYAVNSMNLLKGYVPYGYVPGNHDYDSWIKFKSNGESHNVVSGAEKYLKYFGPASSIMEGQDWFGAFSPNGLSMWSVIDAKGCKILFLGLELEPSDDTILWAQTVIDKNPDLPVIVYTHAFLNLNSDFLDLHCKFPGEGNSAEELWDKLIYPNKNIFLVLCGHVAHIDDGESMRVDKNKYGYTVYSVLSNYQTRNHLYKDSGHRFIGSTIGCGDGWMRFMIFNLKEKLIHVQTYSTEYKRLETDENSDFYLNIDWDWEKRFKNK